MKVQDFAFLAIFLLALLAKNARLAAGLGLLTLSLSIPLFSFWIFFTAQRLVVYAAAFFVLSIIFQLLEPKRRKA